jgi:hypothetical protein
MTAVQIREKQIALVAELRTLFAADQGGLGECEYCGVATLGNQTVCPACFEAAQKELDTPTDDEATDTYERYLATLDIPEYLERMA